MPIGTPTLVGPVVEDVSGGASTIYTVGPAGAAIGVVAVAAISVRTGDTITPAITDSKGNTWEIVEHRTSTSVSHQFMLALARITVALVENDTITVEYNLAVDPNVDSAVMEVRKVSGLDASPLDGTQHTGAGGDQPALIDSGDITPTVGNRIVFGGFGNRDIDAQAPDGDFTALTGGLADPGINSQASRLTWGYISQAWDGSTVVAYETGETPFRWAAAIMSLKEAEAPAGGSGLLRMMMQSNQFGGGTMLG